VKSLLSVESLGVTLGGKAVLKSASAWAREGQITVLLGRNGSGKSTLLKASLGLVALDFGAVRFGPETYLKPNLHELARQGLFFLPDQGLLSRRRTLGWHLSALRRRFPDEFRHQLPSSLAAEPLMGKKSWQLSGGEKRRAGMTLAWSRGPSCLLADEPLAGLAPLDQERIGETLRSLAAEGCAVLLTGHDVRPLLDLAHQVVWMAGGTTHGLGSSEDARVNEQFQREYLGEGL
jgi:ABC-type branched-subunit amino acid transport system ATPase component